MTFQRAAKANSGYETQIQADRGMLEMEYGGAMFSKGWNADWYIWVPDENYPDFLNYTRGNNMVIKPA